VVEEAHANVWRKKHGVKFVGLGIKYGRKLCEGLPVHLRLMDYREVDIKFDRIVSVGMFEHEKN